MATPSIKVTSTSFSKNEVLRGELLRRFPKSVFNSKGLKLSGQSLIDFLGDAQGAVIGLEQINDGILKNCPNLKVIGKYGVGLDNIDRKACQKRGIAVGFTAGVNRLSVAELALGFMLSLCRNFSRASLQLKNGVWNKDGGCELSGKTVGIIGVGHVGKEVVRLLKPFGCKILVNDIIAQDAYYKTNGCMKASKAKIFKECDVVTIHTPLTSQTRKLVNAAALKSMKKSAFLINTARGPIVDQSALKKALKSGLIAGAAIDVYEEEPPSDREFLTLPNLLCTPHIGGNSGEAVLAMGRSAIAHLKGFFDRG